MAIIYCSLLAYKLAGYRRGKPFSNDIDIIFTHKQPGLERHLCTKFVEHLRSRGIVIHTLRTLSIAKVCRAEKIKTLH